MTESEINQYSFKWKQRFYIGGIVALIIIILLSVRTCEANRDAAMADTLYKAVNDTLLNYKDKDGKNHGRITTLETENADQLLALETDKKDIKRLQELVKKNKKSLKNEGIAAVISTEASVDTTLTTGEVVVNKDEPCNPTYITPFDFKEFRKTDTISWVKGKVQMNKDSTGISFKFKEELDIVIGIEPTGFLGLGKGKPYSDVKLGNPYNEVTELRVWKTKLPPTKHIHIGPVGALGVGTGNFTVIQGFIGVGIMYSPNWLSF